MTPFGSVVVAFLLAQAEGGEVSLQVLSAGGRAGVVLSAEGGVRGEVVEGPGELVIEVADARPILPVPAALPPLRSLVVEPGPAGFRLRITYEEGLPHAVERDSTRLGVIVGAAAPLSPEVLAALFPPAAEESGGQVVTGVTAEAPEAEGESRFALRPRISANYVDSTTTFASQTVESRYVQLDPTLAVEVERGIFRLNASYLLRLRVLRSKNAPGDTSHDIGGDLAATLGPSLEVKAGDRFMVGRLEAHEVDPGHEYFFGLGRYGTHTPSLGVTFRPGDRTRVDARGGWTRLRFREESSFFDYDTWVGTLGAGREIGEGRWLDVRYEYARTKPETGRAVAQASSHGVQAVFSGEMAALLAGDVGVTYRRTTAPGAPPSARTRSELMPWVTVRREFSPSSSLALRYSRTLLPSAFEENPHYRSDGVELDLTLPLPAEVYFRGGVGYIRNVYPLPTAGSADPRRDSLLGWSIGAGRSLARSLFVRVDYQRDRRHSTVAAFETRSRSFIFEVGLGDFRRNASP